MAKAFINIGLARNSGLPGSRNSFVQTLDMLEQAVGKVVDNPVQRTSKTETTLVAVIRYDHRTDSQLEDICALLAQDCVAIYTLLDGGKLIGPKAEAWGPFDPAQFILPSGKLLSEVL